MDDLVARRRRAWFFAITMVSVGLLMLAALLPSSAQSIHLDQAYADEAGPAAAAFDASVSGDAPAAVASTEPAPSTTALDPLTASDVGVTTTTTHLAKSLATPAPPTTKVPAKTTVKVTVTSPAPVTTVVTSPPRSAAISDVLACLRNRESHGVYTLVSSSGVYRGAYMFTQGAWDSTANHAGRSDLVGQLANQVAPSDQDALAADLYLWQGSAPWGGACG